MNAKSYLIGGYATTPPSVHDCKGLEELVDESEEAVFADNFYQSVASEAYLLSKDCQNLIQFKARQSREVISPK